ncbi:TrbC/VirB2 family protein [Orientia tsutsugamushi]|uniref:TrbC/VirB2 family protein n=1 Tax=Orientia tsutsugamushi TaxID=784 RepID=UPI00315D7C7D
MKLLSFKQNCYLKPLLMLCFFVLLLSSSIVSAQDAAQADPIGEKLCDIVTILSGKTIKALCLVAIIALGIATFMGKVNMSTAVITLCAIIITTQATKVYEFIAGKDTNGNDTKCEKSSK